MASLSKLSLPNYNVLPILLLPQFNLRHQFTINKRQHKELLEFDKKENAEINFRLNLLKKGTGERKALNEKMQVCDETCDKLEL